MVKGKGLSALIRSHKRDPKKLDKFKIFKDAVKDAFEDEVLTVDEENILDHMRLNLNLSEEERDTIYDDVLEEMGITLHIERQECRAEKKKLAGKKAEIDEVQHKLELAENEASQAEWLIEEAQKERDKYKEEADRLRKKNKDLQTRIEILEMACEKAGIKVKKKQLTSPMPAKPEEAFWDGKKRPLTMPISKEVLKIKVAICAFCGTENEVETGKGEAVVFECSDCGKKSFVSD